MIKPKFFFAILPALSIIASCTSFQEQDELPDLILSAKEISFPEKISSQDVTVQSGFRWQITDKPDWLQVLYIDDHRALYFEWTVSLVTNSWNEGYDRNGIIKFEAGGQLDSVFVTQHGKKGGYIAVESVYISPSRLTLTDGDKATFTAVFFPKNASEKTVMWSSSDDSVATVSSSGKVTAKAPGTATITIITVDGSKKGESLVTVVEK